MKKKTTVEFRENLRGVTGMHKIFWRDFGGPQKNISHFTAWWLRLDKQH